MGRLDCNHGRMKPLARKEGNFTNVFRLYSTRDIRAGADPLRPQIGAEEGDSTCCKNEKQEIKYEKAIPIVITIEESNWRGEKGKIR